MFPGQPLQAMMQGTAQGDAAAQSILPNAYQPQGKAQAKNPFQGSIDLLIDQVLQIAYSVKQQGDAHRECTENLYKIAFDLSKVNNKLADIAEGAEEEANGGY